MPIKLVGVGEQIDDLQPFDPDEFVDALIGAGVSAEPIEPTIATRRGWRGPRAGRARARPHVARIRWSARVVVRDGRVVGRGRASRRAGGPHAEVVALAAAGARGARRHALRHARAVQPPRAARRPARGLVAGGHRAGSWRPSRDPNRAVDGGGARGAPRGRHRGRRRAVSRPRRARQNRAFFTAMARAPPARHAQVRP